MVIDLADSIDTTLVVIDTGVFALLVDASQGSGTVGINCTFWLTLNIGVSLESWWTCANTSAARRSGQSIGPTRIWVTGIKYFWFWWWRPDTFNKSVSNESWKT